MSIFIKLFSLTFALKTWGPLQIFIYVLSQPMTCVFILFLLLLVVQRTRYKRYHSTGCMHVRQATRSLSPPAYPFSVSLQDANFGRRLSLSTVNIHPNLCHSSMQKVLKDNSFTTRHNALQRRHCHQTALRNKPYLWLLFPLLFFFCPSSEVYAIPGTQCWCCS